MISSQPTSPGPRLRVAAAVVVLGGLVLGGLVGDRPGVPLGGPVVAADAMSRDTEAGWGASDQGGTYEVSALSPTVFDVRDGVATMSLESGTSGVATLPQVRLADLRAAAQFSVAELPQSGLGVYTGLQVRDVGGGLYQARARLAPGGRVWVSVVRQDGDPGHLTTLVPETLLVPAVTAEDPVRVELDVTGGAVVDLALRAWVLDRPDETVRVTARDAAAGRVVGPGVVSLWGYVSRTTPSAVVRFDDLVVDDPTEPSPAPGPADDPSTEVLTAPAPDGSAAGPSSGGLVTDPTVTSPPVGDDVLGPPDDDGVLAPESGAVQYAGSLPLGETSYPVPVGAVFVSAADGTAGGTGRADSPLDTVQAAIGRVPDGGTVVVRAGVYHEAVRIPDGKRVTVQSAPGDVVWLDGSRPVTDWTATGGVWVAPWTATFDTSQSFTRGSNAGGFVDPAYPLAADPQQLFVDAAQLQQVAAGVRPGPGQFAVDTAARTLTLGSDPTGHAVRASDLSRAVVAAGPTTLRGIGVRRYATALTDIGTVFLGGRSAGSVVQNVVVQDNATQGLSVTVADVTVDHVTVQGNGMTGIHGNNADRSTFTDDLVLGNNTQHFNAAPSAAGMKITRSRGVTITGSNVRGNLGVDGIWLDESVVGFTVARNTVADNGVNTGIHAELSDTGIIAGNDVSGSRWGIMVQNTGDVQIYNNVLTGNTSYHIGLRQDARREATSAGYDRDRRQPQPDLTVPWITRNVTVANNVFGPMGGSPSANQIWVRDDQTNTPADAMQIVVTGNVFTQGDAPVIAWGAADNRTVRRFTGPAEFAAALGRTDVNTALPAAQLPLAAPDPATAQVAVPMPPDVAAVLHAPTGSRGVGLIW